MNQRKRGFTLMEMLIVVAIIGILVAVSIPVFTSQLKKTKEAVCLANRRSAKGVLAVLAMTEPEALGDIEKDGTYTWETVKKVLADSGHPFDDKICPSNGEISVRKSAESFTFACSIHIEENVRTNWIPEENSADNALKNISKEFQDKYGSADSDKYKNTFKAGGEDIAYTELYKEYMKKNGGALAVKTDELKKYFPDGTSFKDDELYWSATRLYYDNTFHDVLFLTDSTTFNDGKLKAYLISIDGEYYYSTATTWNGKVDGQYIVGGNKNKDKTKEELLASKNFAPVK